MQRAGHGAPTITDARGRVVSRLDPVTMHLLRRHDAVPVGPLREIAQDVGIGMTWATRWMAWAVVVGSACFFVALIILTFKLRSGSIGTRRFAIGLVPYLCSWSSLFTFWGSPAVRGMVGSSA